MISLQVSQLSKSYGRKGVWRDISFTHEEGVLGIAGPNGSGKSTLMQCLAGLLRPSSGTVQWTSGKQSIGNERLKHKMGFAAPYISLYREFSVSENLRFLGKLRKMDLNPSDLQNLLQQVGLEYVAEQPFGTLSTGQQQRARLAAALFTDPEVLMLDEPGSNLDEEGRELVADIVTKARERGKLMILASNATHELELCDRTFHLNGS
jgi:ABC-type multidrug transport system ATPase subunit